MNEPAPTPADSARRLLIVIVNYKTASLTRNCLRSLEPEVSSLPGVHVAVVENDSGDADTLAAIIGDNHWGSWTSLIVAERNGGFAYGNNQAIQPALESDHPPAYFLLLNSDTEIRPGAVRALLDFMDAHPNVGIAGSSFENPDGSDWPYAFRFHTILSQFEQSVRIGLVTWLLKNHKVPRHMGTQAEQVDWVAGASMIIRRQVFDAIGLMDEGYFLYFEEVDFCLRAARAGWPCWYVPQSRVMHISGQSTGVSGEQRHLKRLPAYWFESRHRYFIKNFGIAYARWADLAFGTGFALWRLRRFLFRKPDPDPPHMLGDFWKSSVLFRHVSRQLNAPPAPPGARPCPAPPARPATTSAAAPPPPPAD